jgi:predicted nucleic acid-binding protein
VFLDANIFIHAYNSKDAKGQACSALLRSVSSCSQRATTSWLVLNEVAYYYLKSGRLPSALQFWETATLNPGLQILPIDAQVGRHALHFLRMGLAPSDAFHAAAMKANSIQVLCSYDKGFDKIEGIRRVEPK